MKKNTAIPAAAPWFLALSFTALCSASAHAGSPLTSPDDRAASCQQLFHDYLENHRGEQLERRALQQYFSGNCMPQSHSDFAESTPQRIPTTSSPDRLKLLQVQDADDHIVTYRT